MTQAVSGSIMAPDDHGGAPSEQVDQLYKPYFAAAILVALTAGASWGAWQLWKITFAESFTGIGVSEINAHGHAQIFGWLGLFVMGFAYYGLPWLWNTRLPSPGLAKVNLALILVGLVIRTAGMTLHGSWNGALTAAMVGGCIEVLAIVLFCRHMLILKQKAKLSLTPHAALVLTALCFLLIQAIFSLVHTYNTMTAASLEVLLWHVATYQAMLRDLQIHGLALLMILGVSLRLLPLIFGVSGGLPRRSWIGYGLLLIAIFMEIGFYLVYRLTGGHVWAGLVWLGWLTLPAGAALIVWPWRLWRPFPIQVPGGKFVRAAYAWLFVSLMMLILLPVYQVAGGMAFSHAYYGAVRHAITVGFVSMMILGVSVTVVTIWQGIDARQTSRLWGPFLLLNIGCLLRIALQIATDWTHIGFRLVGFSGLLEVAALAWWGICLTGLMRGRSDSLPADSVIPVQEGM